MPVINRRNCIATAAAFSASVFMGVPLAARADIGARSVFRVRAVIDGSGGRHEKQAVICAGGRIVAVMPDDRRPTGGDWRDVDARAFYLTPGLIECHGHLVLDGGPIDLTLFEGPTDRMVANAERNAAALLDRGVTTLRDLGGAAGVAISLRQRIRRGELRGPRIIAAGSPLTVTGGSADFWGGVVETPDQAAAVVDRQLGAGADVIKIMATGGVTTGSRSPFESVFDQPTMDAIVARAHDAGVKVAAHSHAAAGIAICARAGVDTIEHASFLTPDGFVVDEPTFETLLAAKPHITPTLLGMSKHADDNSKLRFGQRLGVVSRYIENGLQLITGTDAGSPGIGFGEVAEETALLAKAGLMTRQAIVAGAKNAADALGLSGEVGVIEPGAFADFILLEDDPEKDLSALGRPKSVFLAGRLVAGVEPAGLHSKVN